LRKERRLRLFERGIFWPKRDKEREEWSKLHNEELNDLYCSHNIFWVIKSRCVVMRIILRWMSRKWDVRVWTGLIWVRIGTGGGHL
jgi:hypothetical protein